MDSAHIELARIAAEAVGGKTSIEEIHEGAYQAWKDAAGVKDESEIEAEEAPTQEDADEVNGVLREIAGNDDHGISMSIVVPLINTRAEIKEKLKSIFDQPIRNEKFGYEATISSSSIGKLTSNGAFGMTFRNLKPYGFTKDEAHRIHFSATGNVDQLLTWQS